MATMRHSFEGILLTVRLTLAPTANASKTLFPIKQQGKCGNIDEKSQVPIPPQFESASFFSEGLARVQGPGELWGFLDLPGRVVIAPQFEQAGDFSEGLAAVGNPQFKYGFIDRKGGQSTDRKDLYSIRFGKHDTFERLVLDILEWTIDDNLVSKRMGKP